ncbi:prolyl oligopeptidase family serine peptidase [Chryseobacterium wangxinyae]|uniref:prolyl oligopeptidase family serine peptidase n=1 Tax=Chryseobacterium sp. CY353 TaxID=2997334 RepID=UPI0022708DAE|nr:prolyl oligopeptidase family serine peptidase [Chryseobacterium sp. CY353]MCY0968897.1 prolyl oligopeptidase family serine peptidase [Chryseobacterium sp. CY353]
MKRIIFIITIFLTIFLNAQKYNLASSFPISDEYFGLKIVDEYRNLEDLKDVKVVNWMKSQSSYTDSLINLIPNRNYYLEKRLELDKRQLYSISNVKIISNNKYFYLKKNAGETVAKVYYRNGFLGKEELLYDPVSFNSLINGNSSSKSEHKYLINLISPSWDGSKLAISLTEKGKELSEVIIMDVKKKTVLPEIITNTNPSNIGGIKWLEDNSGFFYIYYPVIDNKDSLFAKNTRLVLYKIGEDPKKLKDVFSNINNPELNIGKESYPAILTFNSDDLYYIGILVDSEDFRNTFIISKKDLLNGKMNWKKLYTKDSKVHNIRLIGNDLFFLSGYNSSNYKLCKTNILNPDFKNPKTLIPENENEVLQDYTITSDGIYYTTNTNGVEAKLYLYKDGKNILIKLPYVSGNIDLQSKGKNFSDIWVSCSGWANDVQRFRYSLQTNNFSLENLVPAIEYPEFKDVIVEEITVKSYDGTQVPLSLIYNKNLKKDGTSPVLMNGYGAFAESYSPYFSISYLLWANKGGIVAVPHVRGGGEKGDQWHVDGQKLKKPNSWNDLIACSEYLIEQKYTSSKKIALLGASAGGILMGRAVTERPDLYGAVIIESGVLNTLRVEKNGTGGTTIKEYGDPNNSIEYKGLLEMDAYHHIKKGEKYPAMLISTGINDPRVKPWMSTKFVAKLLANNGSENPILLKIDYEGGHGGSIPIAQRYANIGDIFAFAFWQLGHPDYQPKENTEQ